MVLNQLHFQYDEEYFKHLWILTYLLLTKMMFKKSNLFQAGFHIQNKVSLNTILSMKIIDKIIIIFKNASLGSL